MPAADASTVRALLAAPPLEGDELALVHTDFFAEHPLVDGGAPSGVIDWGAVAIGVPAVDLAFARLAPAR